MRRRTVLGGHLVGVLASEIAGTTVLKLSDGFSRPLPSLAVVVTYGAAVFLFALVVEELPSA